MRALRGDGSRHLLCSTYSGISNVPGAAAESTITSNQGKKSRHQAGIACPSLDMDNDLTHVNSYFCIMNKIIAAFSFDRAALAAVSLASTITLGEAYMRTSLVDADSAKEARYPPLSSIITEGEFIYKVLLRREAAADPLYLSRLLCSATHVIVISIKLFSQRTYVS